MRINRSKRRQTHKSRPRLESLERRDLMAGDLDPTFAYGWGATVTDFGGNDLLKDVAVQTDGKIVAAGSTDYGGGFTNFALSRYDIDGSLDLSFGGGGGVPAGHTITDFDNATNFGAAVVILDDGSIMVAGTSFPTDDGEIVLAKYTANGLLDESFGDDGRVVIEIWTTTQGIKDMFEADGKLTLVTGHALFRRNLDGSVDSSFGGGDGVVWRDEVIPTNTSFQSANYLGGEYVVGWGGQQASVLKLTSAGTVDASFGTEGLMDLSSFDLPSAYVRSVVLLEDGGIVGLASDGLDEDDDAAVFKLDADGDAADGNFSVNGIAELGALDIARSLYVQPEGSIVVVGERNGHLAVARLTSEGTLDTDFAIDGVRAYEVPGRLEVGMNYANGKIVVGGTFGSGMQRDFFLMRLTGDEYEPQFEGPGGLQGEENKPDLPGKELDCDRNPLTIACDVTTEKPVAEKEPEIFHGYHPGDADGDGDTDFVDFLRVAHNFGKENATRPEGDVDGDGLVDFQDFLVVANAFGTQGKSMERAVLSQAGQPGAGEKIATATDQVFAADSLGPIGFKAGGIEPAIGDAVDELTREVQRLG